MTPASSFISKLVLPHSASYRFSIECACLIVMSPSRCAIPRTSLYAAINFHEVSATSRDRLRCISGIESADTVSMKSVWPCRAAEQTLRLRPPTIESTQSNAARLRATSRKGKKIARPDEPSTDQHCKAKPP